MKPLLALVGAVLFALLGPAAGWAGWQEPSVFPRPADPWKHWGRGAGSVAPGFAHPHGFAAGKFFGHPGPHIPHRWPHRHPVWVPGHWVWTGFGWLWQPGHWAW
jgi:hypothetical protein